MFDTDKEKARKLFDLKDFAVYWDQEVMGDLEGQDLVVKCLHVYMLCSFAMPN